MKYEMSLEARLYWEHQLKNGPYKELAKKLLDRADGISEDPAVKHARICRKIREMGIAPASHYAKVITEAGHRWEEDESFEEKYDLGE